MQLRIVNFYSIKYIKSSTGCFLVEYEIHIMLEYIYMSNYRQMGEFINFSISAHFRIIRHREWSEHVSRHSQCRKKKGLELCKLWDFLHMFTSRSSSLGSLHVSANASSAFAEIITGCPLDIVCIFNGNISSRSIRWLAALLDAFVFTVTFATNVHKPDPCRTHFILSGWMYYLNNHYDI